MSHAPVYLDHAATTPVRSEVLEAMLPWFSARFGNPSSVHRFGREARVALDDARERIAATLGAHPDEVCFTSCGTESDNFGVIGAWRAARQKGRNAVLSTPLEHKAVLVACHQIAREGGNERFATVSRDGVVNESSWRDACDHEVAVASAMWVNNETGVVQDIPSLTDVARSSGALMHTDAVQAFGKIAIDLRSLPVDLLTISGHKIGAPKGIGALFIRRGVELEPLMHGGAQDRGRRPGTENVPYAIGLATACELTVQERDAHCAQMLAMRERFEARVRDAMPDVVIHGANALRAPHVTNLSIPGTDAETLLMALDLRGILASGGSACQSGSVGMSHVLSAMGVAPDIAHGALRISFGCLSDDAGVDRAADVLVTLARKARGLVTA